MTSELSNETLSLTSGFNAANIADQPHVAAKVLETKTLYLEQNEDSAIIEASGLIPRSNYVLQLLEDAQNKKRDDQRLQQIIIMQVNNWLDDVERQLADLVAKIEIEQIAIAKNTALISFLDTLDEDNIYNADGSLRSDVAKTLKANGYDDLDKRSATDVMHIIATIKVDAHDDTIIRQDRIADYQDDQRVLRKRVEDAKPLLDEAGFGDRADEILENTDSETTYKLAMKALDENEAALGSTIEGAGLEKRISVETSTFKLG